MSAGDFFDTNVLVYLLSEDADRADQAERLVASGGVVSIQVLNEFASVVTRKFGMTLLEVRQVLSRIRRACAVVPLDIETHERGLALAERHRLAVYDAMIVAAACQAGCTILHTEDLNEVQVIDGLTIRNPFR